MATAFVALGANLGDRLATVRTAIDGLGRLGIVRARSSVYETEPVGYAGQPAYLNAVVRLDTELDPMALLRGLLAIEQEFGRVRTFPNAPRTLDLDLLLYDDLVLDEEQLTVPHPRMSERAFVLVPLHEIAPELIVPGAGRSVSDLLAGLEPVTGVARFAPASNASGR
jgi:2-amino-4-hydroxy-6-hydroxymethyldihydropteridine diphosphokinase